MNGLRLVVDNIEPQLLVAEFEQFWRAYPRKSHKGDAAKAWYQVRRERPPMAEILKAINAAMRSMQWRKSGGDYIPYPATWLRAWGWEDEQDLDLPPMAEHEQQGKKWWQTAPGIEATGREFGLSPQQFSGPDGGRFPAFRAAVMAEAKRRGLI